MGERHTEREREKDKGLHLPLASAYNRKAQHHQTHFSISPFSPPLSSSFLTKEKKNKGNFFSQPLLSFWVSNLWGYQFFKTIV